MKVILNLCVICLIVALVGCETTESTASPTISPGAINDAQNSTNVCPFSGSNADASLGAVNDSPSCCGSCGKSKASLGAVSEVKSCSGAVKSSCSAGKANASLGAVSDKPSHCSGSGPCPYAGQKSDG
ncbi:MAG: hypothetical protein IID30_11650 [Planctomycetes bacterium]|nr:hypothetical protein [Planctomycetota bacterium]